MSKAFTREDDGAVHVAVARARTHAGPVTPLGARLARERMAELSARLERVSGQERALLEVERERVAVVASAPVGPVAGPRDKHDKRDVVAFGAQVSVRDPQGKDRVVVVASADEIGLVPHAASATSPIARALLGAHAGDVVEFSGPRGLEELTIVDVRFPS
jgi:transcription elongation GreA/GreB family factor